MEFVILKTYLGCALTAALQQIEEVRYARLIWEVFTESFEKELKLICEDKCLEKNKKKSAKQVKATEQVKEVKQVAQAKWAKQGLEASLLLCKQFPSESNERHMIYQATIFRSVFTNPTLKKLLTHDSCVYLELHHIDNQTKKTKLGAKTGIKSKLGRKIMKKQ